MRPTSDDVSKTLVLLLLPLGCTEVSSSSADRVSPHSRRIEDWLPSFSVAGEPVEQSRRQTYADEGNDGAVTGTAVLRFVTDSGIVERNNNISSVPIGAWVYDPTLGFLSYPGMGFPNGTFTVPGVPDGEFYFRYNTTYVVTSNRVLDVGFYLAGRPEAAFLTGPGTRLDLGLFGLTPWDPSDAIDLVSSNAGVIVHDLQRRDVSGRPLHPYDTELFQLEDFSGQHTIDGTRGDQTVIYQLARRTPVDPVFPFLITASTSFRSSAITIVDGQTTSIFGELTEIPQDQLLSLRWNVSTFRPYGGDINPAAEHAVEQITIAAHVGGAAHGLFASPAELALFLVDPSSPDQETEFAYVNHLPEWGAPILLNYSAYLLRYRLPGAEAYNASPGIFGIGQLSDFEDGLTVRISPARNLTLNGVSAFEDQFDVGLNPVLAWDPPEIGAPTHYRLSLFELFVDAQNRTQRRFGPRIYTQSASVTVPPGVLELGKVYYATLDAVDSPGAEVTRAPLIYSIPEMTAQTATGVFRP